MAFNIDTWLDGTYTKKLSFEYKRNAEAVERKCRDALVNAKISYLSSFRIKSGKSLKAKLEKIQNLDPNYHLSADTITGPGGVFDIAGVRIAVYTPDDLQRAQEVIESKCGFSYHVRDIRDYSPFTRVETSTQPAYTATHLIVSVDEDGLTLPVELQVMMVLKSSFGHIEHDYVYKKVHPDASEAELKILFAYGKAIDHSEELLKELSRLRQQRLEAKFKDIHGLGSFLITWWHENVDDQVKIIGPLGALYQLLLKKEVSSLITRGGLWVFLTENIAQTTKQPTKTPTPNVRFVPTLLIIDKVFQKYGVELQPSSEPVRNEEKYDRRLKVIMSTILWLSEFFSPAEWENALLEKLTTPQMRQLSWLASSAPCQLVRDRSHFNNRVDNCKQVDGVWDLFKTHSCRAVKLVWELSNSGILRVVAEETDLFNRVFIQPGRTLNNHISQGANPSLP
ncbi:hypothetical protein BJX68DRAFT_267183 [Aspergillus pseudodeflectus]|uniref:RelA/SpoT domain-containing protein n=1 Tax=Aspergillus pseudodeflectus TaxID=176178 RepID=A0ABR4KAL3_9EURO